MTQRSKITPTTKSFFITFEGGEGAGKTTLITRLKAYFESRGRSVLVTREPGGTPLGEAIRDLALSKDFAIHAKAELFLFLASRAQHLEDVILPALYEGKIVCCDRFTDSTIAYQGFARKIGTEVVKALCDYASDGLTPDLTLYLDVTPDVGLSRAKQISKEGFTPGQSDRIESLQNDFHLLVREGFLDLARKNPKRIKVLDASLDPNEVFELALQELKFAF